MRPLEDDTPLGETKATVEAAVREVESGLEELGDPEGGPTVPAATLAAHTALAGRAPLRGLVGAGTTEPRELLRLAGPVMLTMGLAALGNMVDRAMIGWLDGGANAAQALAGAAYATQFFFLIQSSLFAVGLACVAVMARSIGAGRTNRARATLAAALQIALGVTVVMAGAFFALAPQGLAALGASPDVVATALPYLYCLLSSSTLLAFSLIIDSGLRANQDTLTPMRVAAGVSAVKLVGNAVLIYGWFGLPALGLTGAGVATLLSQGVGVALFAAALRRQPRESPVRIVRRDWARARVLRRDVVRIALPGVAERMVMSAAQMGFFAILGHYYGTTAVAVYAVGVPLMSLTWLPGQGYAQAAASLVGHALGASDPARAVRVGWSAAGLALLTALALGVPVSFGRESLAALFTGDAGVIAALGPFLLVLAATQPFLQVHFTLAGVHRGAGDTWTPLAAATVSNGIRLALAGAAAAWLELSVVWVWAAIFADHCSRAGLLLIAFRRGRWLADHTKNRRSFRGLANRGAHAVQPSKQSTGRHV